MKGVELSIGRCVRKGIPPEGGRKTQGNMRKDCVELLILDQGKEKPLDSIIFWFCPATKEHHPRDYIDSPGTFSTICFIRKEVWSMIQN